MTSLTSLGVKFSPKESSINADTTLADHQNLGQDLHSIVADPLFVDADNGDYRLSTKSPAISQLGFSTPWLIEENGGFLGMRSLMMSETLLLDESISLDEPLIVDSGPVTIDESPALRRFPPKRFTDKMIVCGINAVGKVAHSFFGGGGRKTYI